MESKLWWKKTKSSDLNLFLMKWPTNARHANFVLRWQLSWKQSPSWFFLNILPFLYLQHQVNDYLKIYIISCNIERRTQAPGRRPEELHRLIRLFCLKLSLSGSWNCGCSCFSETITTEQQFLETKWNLVTLTVWSRCVMFPSGF